MPEQLPNSDRTDCLPRTGSHSIGSRSINSSIAHSLEEVRRLFATGQHSHAIIATEAAAKAGNAEAAYLFATWLLGGFHVKRDVKHALRLLDTAAQLGHLDASQMQIALMANGAIGPPNWAKALMLLKRAASKDALALRQLQLINAMALSPAGYPVKALERLKPSGKESLWVVPHLLTADECYYIANKAAPMLQPSQVADPKNGRLRAHPIRVSHDTVIGPTQEDLVIAAINRRIASVTDTDLGQGEPLTVLCYRQGGQYKPHLDTLPHGANVRKQTLIVYLNDNYCGGETEFLALKLRIQPRAGMAIMFDNYQSDGTPDTRMVHAGLQVMSGTKWVATRWIREYPLNIWHTEDRIDET